MAAAFRGEVRKHFGLEFEADAFVTAALRMHGVVDGFAALRPR
jgi:hypothetical protein